MYNAYTYEIGNSTLLGTSAGYDRERAPGTLQIYHIRILLAGSQSAPADDRNLFYFFAFHKGTDPELSVLLVHRTACLEFLFNFTN